MGLICFFLSAALALKWPPSSPMVLDRVKGFCSHCPSESFAISRRDGAQLWRVTYIPFKTFKLFFALYLPSPLGTVLDGQLREDLDGSLNSRFVTKQPTKAAKASRNISML